MEEAKRAYRELAKKYHPDINKTAHAEEKMREITEAWEMLKDGGWESALTCRHRTVYTFTETEE